MFVLDVVDSSDEDIRRGGGFAHAPPLAVGAYVMEDMLLLLLDRDEEDPAGREINLRLVARSFKFSSPTCNTRCRLASAALIRLLLRLIIPGAADIPRCILSSEERPERRRAFSTCCHIGE